MLYYEAVIGIDPGKLGAIVVLDTGSGLLRETYRMPAEPCELKKILTKIENRYESVMVALEKAQSGSSTGAYRNSVKSMFTYGKHIGHLEAVIALMHLPCMQVAPQTWTSEMLKGYEGVNGKAKSKQAVLTFWAEEELRFPGRATKMHEGIVDACLIAEYVRRRVKL